MSLTKQEIFTKAYQGLKSQGFQRSVALDIFGCAYRGAAGKKCAIGHLIPDENYRPSLEISCASSPKVRQAANIPDGVSDEFLIELQRCHDMSSNPTHMQNNLDRFIEKYNLVIED